MDISMTSKDCTNYVKLRKQSFIIYFMTAGISVILVLHTVHHDSIY